jgi:nitroimidazol reductase NimA-like FMN-containing flavoprotein (pyridoxamine 5'-phosphate oxidase superfamily)
VRDDRWQELTDDECRRLLGERHLGRLALVDGDGPVIFPVNYTLDEGAVVFRTDPGSKLDAAPAGGPVAFEVDAVDERDRTGWSVVVRGQAGEVSDPADLQRLRALPLYPWAPGTKTRYVRIRPVSVTGRRIAIPASLPFTWWADGATEAVSQSGGGRTGPTTRSGGPRHVLVAGFLSPTWPLLG